MITQRTLLTVSTCILALIPVLASAQEVVNPVPVPAETANTPAAPAAQGQIPAPAPTTAPPADGTIVSALPANPTANIAATTPMEQEISQHLTFLQPTVNVDAMKSLFFSIWEHDLVLDARRGLTTRIPGSDDGVDPSVASGPRDIELGGIVFANSKDWTIWLNSIRVSPDAIPDEVIDLKVFKTYVELEWFDKKTNQIYPIRLRAHQRFNLDTRMFLPG